MKDKLAKYHIILQCSKLVYTWLIDNHDSTQANK